MMCSGSVVVLACSNSSSVVPLLLPLAVVLTSTPVLRAQLRVGKALTRLTRTRSTSCQ
jgi:hypothetical protein